MILKRRICCRDNLLITKKGRVNARPFLYQLVKLIISTTSCSYQGQPQLETQ